jgi:hypothetical protein
VGSLKRRREERGEASVDAALSWTVGCLVGAAAIVGTLILVLVVTFAVQPPGWVQAVLGIALLCGGALLAWLVASAFRQARSRRAPPRHQGPGPY